MTAAPRPPIPRIFYTVQYLRGLGALAVILWHGLGQLSRFQPHLAYPEWGAVAVDMFFVISGFVMWHITAGGEGGAVGEYCRRRIVRAVPFYWAMTSIVVVAMMVAPHLLSSSRYDGGHVLASYFFVPWLHPVLHGEILPVVIPGWTLDYEFPFYGLVGLSLFIPLRFRAAALIVAILTLALLPAFISIDSTALYFYTQPIVIEFASGVFLGWLVWNGYRLNALAALSLLVLGFIAVPLLPSPSHVVPEIGAYRFMLQRVLEYCGPAFAIVAGAVFYETARGSAPRWRIPKLIGDASYSIYLLHPLVLPVITRLWLQTGLAADPRWNGAYIVVAVAVAAGAGIGCYFVLEKPLLAFFNRMTLRKTPRLSAA